MSIIAPETASALLERLVAIDSRNPSIADGSPGEGPIAAFVADWLTAAGLHADIIPAIDGRPNVLGILPGSIDATIILEAHLDTVPGGPLPHRDGRRLYARGACDTKASLAAMMVAAARIVEHDGPTPTVIVAGVCDEEYIMRGAIALADRLPAADLLIVGEPTSLVPARAHNGFIRFQANVLGRAAHSSRAELGVNAIEKAALLLARLEETLISDRRASPGHDLAGKALLSATLITGGLAPNIVPDRCQITFDRRVSPQEDPDEVLREIHSAVRAFAAEIGVDVELPDPFVSLRGFETPADSPGVVAVERAASAVLGRDVEAIGVTYSTDACAFQVRDDLPCVVFGPGSIDQAHTDDEWVDLDEVDVAADIFHRVILELAATEEGSIP